MPQLHPVDALSDSDAEPVRGGLPAAPIGAVHDLTDSSSRSAEIKEVGLRRKRRKRKRSDGVLESNRSARLTQTVHCRALLGRVCKSCKRSCLNVFLEKNRLERFLDFRKHWKSIHKLDQDKIVSLLHLVLVLFLWVQCQRLAQSLKATQLYVTWNPGL